MRKTFKVNLTTAHFPTLVSKASRSVALPDPADGTNTLTSTYVGRMAGTNMYTPAPIAMENVIPTVEGLSSYGYADAPGEGVTVITSKGIKFAKSNTSYALRPIQAPGYPATTIARVQGRLFAFNPTVGLWDLTTEVSEPMVGFSSDNGILGIVECNNHLVAYDYRTIYTSSIEVATFFTPDLGVGAGSSIPQGLQGNIVICVPVKNGFIIFTTREAILAQYKDVGLLAFTTLEGVGGINFCTNVTSYDNSGVIYAYTTSGLVAIEGDKVTPVFPEITEFLQQGVEEIYDSPFGVRSTEQRFLSEAQTYPVTTDLVSIKNTYFRVGLFSLNNRYVYISYGNASLGGVFTHTFVYDSVLARFGKLKTSHIHIDCGFDTPVFVGEAATSCKYGGINFQANAMLLIGKIALQRDKTVTLQEVEIEYALPSAGHYLGVYTTLDGKNLIERTQLASMLDSTYYHKWHTRKSGKSVVLRLDGAFHLASMQVTLTTGGFR